MPLACSEVCTNQAFRFGPRAYGLQFHPEVSPEMLADWIKEAGDTPAELTSFQRAVDEKAKALRAQAERLVGNFLRAITPRHSDG